MSKDNQSLTDKNMAQYLDQEVPLQQLESDDFNDLPPFIHAQLTYAKSKQGRQAKRKQTAYKKGWVKKGGINE